jgi:flagellar hook-length control protein FliK
MPSANAVSSAVALVSDRGGGKQHDTQDSSAFDALLGALDNAVTPPIEVSPAATSWRSISAGRALGSAALNALDKRLGAAATGDQPAVAGKTSKADVDGNADAAALANINWTSLIPGMTGATAAPSGASTNSSISPSTGPTIAKAGTNSNSTIHAAATSDQVAAASEALALPTQALAPNVASVDVKVVRSITYLGLDSTAPDLGASQAPASGPTRPATVSEPEIAPAHEHREYGAVAAVPNAQGGSPTMTNEEQSRRHSRNDGDESAPTKVARVSQETTSAAGQTSPAASAPAVAQTDAGMGMMSGMDAPLVAIAQLADVIASAAGELDSQVDSAAAPVETAKAASLARTGPVKELDVQLNPASLGALSIQMRLSNGNLNVTIKADNAGTLKLIENERGSISDKLKSMEFSVESLTVKASDAVASSSASADAPNSGSSNYGETQQGRSGQADDGARNGRSFQDGESQRRAAQQSPSPMGEAGGGDLGHRFV